VKTGKASHRGTARSIGCLTAAMFASGCIVTRDVTDNADLCGGFSKGVSFALVSDVAVTEFGILLTSA